MTRRSPASGASSARCGSSTVPTKSIGCRFRGAKYAAGSNSGHGAHWKHMPERQTQISAQNPGQALAQTSGADDLAAEYGEVREEERLDWPRLQAYLREHEVPGAGSAMEVKQFRGGSSNLTYLLRFADGHQWVVRRPPFGPLPPSAHDMAREYRLLSRLWEGFPAAPRSIVLCEDPAIIGAQ